MHIGSGYKFKDPQNRKVYVCLKPKFLCLPLLLLFTELKLRRRKSDNFNYLARDCASDAKIERKGIERRRKNENLSRDTKGRVGENFNNKILPRSKLAKIPF